MRQAVTTRAAQKRPAAAADCTVDSQLVVQVFVASWDMRCCSIKLCARERQRCKGEDARRDFEETGGYVVVVVVLVVLTERR